MVKKGDIIAYTVYQDDQQPGEMENLKEKKHDERQNDKR